jgi:hypothetical protein
MRVISGELVGVLEILWRVGSASAHALDGERAEASAGGGGGKEEAKKALEMIPPLMVLMTEMVRCIPGFMGALVSISSEYDSPSGSGPHGPGSDVGAYAQAQGREDSAMDVDTDTDTNEAKAANGIGGRNRAKEIGHGGKSHLLTLLSQIASSLLDPSKVPSRKKGKSAGGSTLAIAAAAPAGSRTVSSVSAVNGATSASNTAGPGGDEGKTVPILSLPDHTPTARSFGHAFTELLWYCVWDGVWGCGDDIIGYVLSTPSKLNSGGANGEFGRKFGAIPEDTDLMLKLLDKAQPAWLLDGVMKVLVGLSTREL